MKNIDFFDQRKQESTGTKFIDLAELITRVREPPKGDDDDDDDDDNDDDEIGKLNSFYLSKEIFSNLF